MVLGSMLEKAWLTMGIKMASPVRYKGVDGAYGE